MIDKFVFIFVFASRGDGNSGKNFSRTPHNLFEVEATWRFPASFSTTFIINSAEFIL